MVRKLKNHTSSKFCSFAFLAVLSVALLVSNGAAVPIQDSERVTKVQEPSSTTPETVTGNGTDEPVPLQHCQPSTPCGWAVYVPFERTIEYFVRNTCICPPDKSCVRHEDELAIAAYSYRCGEKQATTEYFQRID